MIRAFAALLVSLAAGLGLLAGHRVFAERCFESDHPAPGAVAGEAGRRIHLIERGAGGVPVIMIHGNPGTALDFARVQDALGDRRSAAADRPGYGYSDRPSASMAPEAQAEAIREATRARGIDRAVLAGFSYGGPVVLAWARRHPEDAVGLVLIAAVGSPQIDLEISGVQKLLAKPVVGPLFAWTVAPLAAPGVIEERYANFFSPDPVDPAALDRGKLLFARPVTLISSAHDWATLESIFPEHVAGHAELKMPVSIITGTADRSVSPDHSRFLAEALPQASLRQLDGAGHALLYTHSGTVAAAIARLANSAEPEPRGRGTSTSAPDLRGTAGSGG